MYQSVFAPFGQRTSGGQRPMLRVSAALVILAACVGSSAGHAQSPLEEFPIETGTTETPPGAKPKTWDITLGGGGGLRPVYPGAESFRFTPVPIINITYGDLLFLGGNGLGVYALRTDTMTLGASVSLRSGRDEDDDDHLRGLGDIDMAVQGRLFGRIRLGPVTLGATVARDFGGSDGITADLSLSSPFRVTDRLRLIPGVAASIGDDKYMQTWFGVSQAQAQGSGLPAFDAGAGLKSVGAFVSGNYKLTAQWSLISTVRVEYLTGDAGDSPITERRVQPVFVLGVAYHL